MPKKDYPTSLFLILILLGAAIIPIVLNFILSVENPTNLNITGEGKDWLAFYGSYIGGVATASISFFVLLRTIKSNREEAEINRKEHDLFELRNDLAKKVSALNFSRIGIIALVQTNHSLCKQEILKLDEFHQELTRDLNSFYLVYESSRDLDVINFRNCYKRCILQIFDDITKMTRFIAELPPSISPEQKLFFQETIHRYEILSSLDKEGVDYKTKLDIVSYKEAINSERKRDKILLDINNLVSLLGTHKGLAEEVLGKHKSGLKESKVN